LSKATIHGPHFDLERIGTVGRGPMASPAGWPLHDLGQCVHARRVACAWSLPREWPECTSWCGGQRLADGRNMAKVLVKPSTDQGLHAATPKPRSDGWEKGSHRLGGGERRRRRKPVRRWVEAPQMSPSARAP
jgi:hypothetical protein